MSGNPDIIIIGAGIVGAACALECARNGLKVRVLERGVVGGGTTAAGMGHLVVMDDSEAQFQLTRFSRQLWLDLSPNLPAEVEFDKCGTLWVAADEQEMAEVRRKEAAYMRHGVRVEVLDGASAARLEPNLRPGMAGALRVADDAVLYPPAAARYLLAQARALGTEVRTGTAVKTVAPDGTVALFNGEQMACGRAVIATGPWAPDLLPGLAVRKRRGHLVITDRHPGFVRHQLIELGYLKSAHSTTRDSVAFNIQPRKNGQMLIGSSRQFDVETDEVDADLMDRMLRRAMEYLPGLGMLSAIRAWTGHRAATPDKLPLIGPSLAHDRIWLATGHEGLGITTSLGTGRQLADMLLGRTPPIDAGPYLPGRKGVEAH